jgi:hypothetical protein
MAYRTLDDVLEEARSEGHEPMGSLLDALRREPWARTLSYDMSMLRLWISQGEHHAPVIQVVYADGRGGGRPSPPYSDAFELTLLSGFGAGVVKCGVQAEVIASLGHWAAGFGPERT